MMHEGFETDLRELAARGRLRSLRERSGIDFTSNDYLGLAESEELIILNLVVNYALQNWLTTLLVQLGRGEASLLPVWRPRKDRRLDHGICPCALSVAGIVEGHIE
jgi:hypothetical protein